MCCAGRLTFVVVVVLFIWVGYWCGDRRDGSAGRNRRCRCCCMTILFRRMLVMVLDDGDRSFILTVSVHCSTDEVRVEEAFWNMFDEKTRSPSRRIDLFLFDGPHRAVSSGTLSRKSLLKLPRQIHLLIYIIAESMYPSYVRFRIGVNQTLKCNCIAN